MSRVTTCVVGLALAIGGATSARAQPASLLIEDLTWTEVRDAIAAGKTTAVDDKIKGAVDQIRLLVK